MAVLQFDPMTPFEMAIELRRAGWDVPPYPTPLGFAGASDEPADARVVAATYLHLCDAWEWQVERLHAAFVEKQAGPRES